MPTSTVANTPARPRHSARRLPTADHPGIVACGRAGWCARGSVYVVAGALILAVAAKASGWATTAAVNEASPTGAFATVADSTGGSLVLVLLAAGMLLYAGWRLVTAALPGATNASAMLHRIGYVVSASRCTPRSRSRRSSWPGTPRPIRTATDVSAICRRP